MSLCYVLFSASAGKYYVGSTGDFCQSAHEHNGIINLTADAHPIHLHLIQFQLVNRQDFQVSKYLKAYGAAFSGGQSPVD